MRPPLLYCPLSTQFSFIIVPEHQCHLYPYHAPLLHLGSDDIERVLPRASSVSGPINEIITPLPFLGSNAVHSAAEPNTEDTAEYEPSNESSQLIPHHDFYSGRSNQYQFYPFQAAPMHPFRHSSGYAPPGGVYMPVYHSAQTPRRYTGQNQSDFQATSNESVGAAQNSQTGPNEGSKTPLNPTAEVFESHAQETHAQLCEEALENLRFTETETYHLYTEYYRSLPGVFYNSDDGINGEELPEEDKTLVDNHYWGGGLNITDPLGIVATAETSCPKPQIWRRSRGRRASFGDTPRTPFDLMAIQSEKDRDFKRKGKEVVTVLPTPAIARSVTDEASHGSQRMILEIDAEPVKKEPESSVEGALEREDLIDLSSTPRSIKVEPDDKLKLEDFPPFPSHTEEATSPFPCSDTQKFVRNLGGTRSPDRTSQKSTNSAKYGRTPLRDKRKSRQIDLEKASSTLENLSKSITDPNPNDDNVSKRGSKAPELDSGRNPGPRQRQGGPPGAEARRTWSAVVSGTFIPSEHPRHLPNKAPSRAPSTVPSRTTSRAPSRPPSRASTASKHDDSSRRTPVATPVIPDRMRYEDLLPIMTQAGSTRTSPKKKKWADLFNDVPLRRARPPDPPRPLKDGDVKTEFVSPKRSRPVPSTPPNTPVNDEANDISPESVASSEGNNSNTVSGKKDAIENEASNTRSTKDSEGGVLQSEKSDDEPPPTPSEVQQQRGDEARNRRIQPRQRLWSQLVGGTGTTLRPNTRGISESDNKDDSAWPSLGSGPVKEKRN